MAPKPKFIPALSHDWLTPFYDTVVRLTMPEERFKRQLINQAEITRGQQILDLGCGSGTLTILIKKLHPDAFVIGADGDAQILKLAQEKASKADVRVEFTHAMAFELPYEENSFDRVLTSLMFHHLTREGKLRTLREIRRVLNDSGEVHIADFGKPHNFPMRLVSYPWLLFDRSGRGADIIAGVLPALMQDCGFTEVRESEKYSTLFGTLALYSARKGHH